MPFLLDLLFASACGFLAFLLTLTYPWRGHAPRKPALDAAAAIGTATRGHRRLEGLLRARVDPTIGAGLLLTVALVPAIGGGLALGVLAYLTRSLPALQRFDDAAADWGSVHASSISTEALRAVTNLGATSTAVLLAVLVAAIDLYRTRNRFVIPFFVIVLAGQGIISNAVKDLAGRVRPAIDPAAAGLGPSFPSGHSATSAACFAAAALILGRYTGQLSRATFTGAAVGIAVAVAGSRVLLDVHWLSDVTAGLALGWGWFAICAIAFGGRLLKPAVAKTTAAAASKSSRSNH